MRIFMDHLRPGMAMGGRGGSVDHMDTAAFVPDSGYSDYMTTSYAPMSNDIVLRHSYLYKK